MIQVLFVFCYLLIIYQLGSSDYGDHSVDLTWKNKDNQLIFICKVSKPFLPVVISRESIDKAFCAPNPEPVCHVINPHEGSVLFKKSTNELIYTITNYKLETVNGDWSCSHGSGGKNPKDSVAVNIYDTCPYVYVGVLTSLLVTFVVANVIEKCKNASIAAKGVHGDQEITSDIQQNNCGETNDEDSNLLQIDQSKKGAIKGDKDGTEDIPQNTTIERSDINDKSLKNYQAKERKKGAIKGDKNETEDIQQITTIERSDINDKSLKNDQAKERKKVAFVIICLLLLLGYISMVIVYVQKYCYCTEYFTIISAGWIAGGLIVGIIICVLWSKVGKRGLNPHMQ